MSYPLTPQQAAAIENLPALTERMERALARVELSKKKWLTKDEAKMLLVNGSNGKPISDSKLRQLVEDGKITVNQNRGQGVQLLYLRTSIEEYLDNPQA